VNDAIDFASLKNLSRGCVDRARRAKSKFLSENAVRQLQYETYQARKRYYEN
jgi:hypothetical protein